MEHSVRKASVGVAAKTLLPFCYLEHILLKWARLLLFHFHLQPFNFRLCCLHMSVKFISLIFFLSFIIGLIQHDKLLLSGTYSFCRVAHHKPQPQHAPQFSAQFREEEHDRTALKHLWLWESTRQTAEHFEPDRAERWEGMTWSSCYLAQMQLCFSVVSMYLRWIVIWRRSAPGWVWGERKCSVNEIKAMFTERRRPFQRNSHGPDRLQICFHVSSRAGWWHLPTLFTQTGEWDFLTSIKAVARKQICSLLT